MFDLETFLSFAKILIPAPLKRIKVARPIADYLDSLSNDQKNKIVNDALVYYFSKSGLLVNEKGQIVSPQLTLDLDEKSGDLGTSVNGDEINANEIPGKPVKSTKDITA